jgi:hypothetical protein
LPLRPAINESLPFFLPHSATSSTSFDSGDERTRSWVLAAKDRDSDVDGENFLGAHRSTMDAIQWVEGLQLSATARSAGEQPLLLIPVRLLLQAAASL